MKKAGLIMQDIYSGFNHKYNLVKHHPYQRDWIEVEMKKDYLDADDFAKITKICKEHNLSFHVMPRGKLFRRRIVLCIYDKEEN